MASIEVELPDDLQRFIQEQIEHGSYRSASDYLEALVARAKAGKERLESLLIEGLDSGRPMAMDDSQWKDIRAEVHDRLTG